MFNKIKRFTMIIFLIEFAVWILMSRSAVPILIVLAIIIHEVGHIAVSFIVGNLLSSISLRVGGLALSGRNAFPSYKSEIFIALGGPLSNLIFAVLVLVAFNSPTAEYFAKLSFALALLNLLPIKAFDGGRIFKALLASFLPEKLSVKICELISFFTLFSLWSVSIYLLLRTGRNLTFFLFSFSVFLRLFAEQTEVRICKIIEE